MKIKNILFGTMFAGIAASASAQTTDITITGATAFRQATMQAIYDAYASMGAAGTSFNVAHDFPGNTSDQISQLIASNKAVFSGSFPGINGTTVIRTSFNGSTEGLNAIAGNSNPTFLTVGALSGGNYTTGTGSAGIKAATTAPNQNNIRPKFSFSDVYQSTSPVRTDLNGAPITLNPSGSSAVGIVTFAMIANDGAPANLTNVTTQQARALWTNGAQPLSLFTGDPTDTKRVYATGRNDGSGTRSAYLTEWTFGVANLVKQYVATSAGTAGGNGLSAATPSGVGNGTINRLTLVPANGIGGGNVTVNGTVASGSTTIVLNALPTYNDTTISTGNIISGTGLGANTTITARTGDSSAYTLTLSNATTAQISNGATLLVNGIGNFTTDRTADASTLWGQTNAGNGGYGSSSALRTLMGYTSSNVTIYNGVSQNTSVNNRDIVLLTWLSTADCRDAALEGAKILSFNGVGVTPLSKVQAAIVDNLSTPENEKVNYLDSGFNEADFKKIASGAYSAWSYQHLYYHDELEANQLTWYNAMKNTWLNQGLQKTANGLRSSDVSVDRADDGLPIFAPL
jgi:hypothetical protein